MNKHWCDCYTCSRNKEKLEKIETLAESFPKQYRPYKALKEILHPTIGGECNG